MIQDKEQQAGIDSLGRLSDPQAEKNFQQAKLQLTRKRLRFVCIITGIAYLGAIYADSYQISGNRFDMLLAARLFTALIALIPLFLSCGKDTAPTNLGLSACAYMTTLMGTECLELFLKADTVVLRDTPITALIVLAFYLFQPPQIWQSIIAGGLGSLAYLFVLTFLTNAPPDYIANTALVFGLANGFGLYFSIRFGASQRREYAALTELKRKAETDALTGLLNRRRVVELGEREFSAAKRHGSPCSLLLMDIDHFKKVNDSAGHTAGDVILSSLAERCSRIIRVVDIFGRVGGEEFAVFMPHATKEQAMLMAERIRHAVGDTPFQIDDVPMKVTLSIGVATLTSETDTLETLYRMADDALYAAKRCGRNGVHS